MQDNVKIWINEDGWPPKPPRLPIFSKEHLLRFEIDLKVYSAVDSYSMPWWLKLHAVGRAGIFPGYYTEEVLCSQERLEEFQDWCWKIGAVKILGIRPVAKPIEIPEEKIIFDTNNTANQQLNNETERQQVDPA